MLEKILGEELYSEVTKKLGDKKIDIVNDGERWIPLEKFDSVIKEKNELKKQLEEIKPDAEALEQKKQELWQMEKELLLEKHNLGDFNDFFNAEDSNTLEEQIESFKEVLQNKFKENQVNSNYTPQNHKPTDAYAEASKNGDIHGMLNQKLSSIFK